MFDLTRSDLLRRMTELDEEVSLMFPHADRIRLVIAGGGALSLMNYISRVTHDIDVLSVSHAIHDIMAHYDMNTNVQTYINNFPLNFEDRIIKVPIETRLIDFYTASLEDIVIAKLQSVRTTDLSDITSPDILNSIDWERLDELATAEDELQASAMNEFRYREFLDLYHNYVGRYKPCDN